MENEKKDETLLSVSAAAKYLGISTATLWRKLGTKKNDRKDQVIGCYRIGNRIVLSKEKHLEAYLSACEQKPVTN
jgi:hypothetical protein